MSTPISTCLLVKAALGDETAFNQLVEAMEYNLSCGHWSVFPCRCDPPCPQPEQERMEALSERLNRVLRERKAERAKKAPPISGFDKPIPPMLSQPNHDPDLEL